MLADTLALTLLETEALGDAELLWDSEALTLEEDEAL